MVNLNINNTESYEIPFLIAIFQFYIFFLLSFNLMFMCSHRGGMWTDQQGEISKI